MIRATTDRRLALSQAPRRIAALGENLTCQVQRPTYRDDDRHHEHDDANRVASDDCRTKTV
eukprot:316720-Amphidinium_carterae.1